MGKDIYRAIADQLGKANQGPSPTYLEDSAKTVYTTFSCAGVSEGSPEMVSFRKTERGVAYVAAGLVALMGVLVMAAWHAHWVFILQLTPGLVPMQYNTALGFFVTGLSLLLVPHDKTRKAGLLFAVFAFVFAGLTGLQYVVKADFGLDRLFFEAPYVQTRTSHAGRMAPNTALLFMMTATAVMFLRFGKAGGWRLNASLVLGIFVLLVSVIALAGYLAGIEAAYSWWGMSDMAPQTALAFLLCGVALYGQCRHILRREDSGTIRHWMPVYAALAGIVMTLLITQGVLYFDKRFAVQIVNRATQRTAQLVKMEMRHILSLRHTQVRWSPDNEKRTAKDWREEAAGFLADNPDYLSVALYDKNMALRAASPPEAEDRWKSVPESLLGGARGKQIYAAGRMEMEDGRKAALFVIPLHTKGKNDGFLATAYDIDGVMPGILNVRDENATFSYAITDAEGKAVFASAVMEGASRSPWGVSQASPVDVPGLGWEVRVALENLNRQNGNLALLVVICGTMFSFLLANAMRQADKIQRYQRRLESVMDNIVDGLATIDDKGIVQSYNKACERIFGYGANEVIGQNVSMLMPDEHAVRHDGYLESYKATGVGKIIGVGRELEGRRKNGAHFPLELSVAEVRLGGQRIFSGIIRDISERKAAETALQRSHDELEQFAYVASHDLKAPLRGIDNLASWIAEDLEDVMTPDAAEKFDLMRSRVKRLETLLDDILRYSRAGRITDLPEKVDVGGLLEAICVPLATENIRLEVATGMPVLHTHRTPLEQVFSNLVLNAIKHHDREDVSVRVTCRDRGTFYEFGVIDDGPGIPPEFHERVFQMFQTLHPRDKREGSGLGMAIVKKLVEWQGGKIWIVSQEGARGTEVRFQWPKAGGAD